MSILVSEGEKTPFQLASPKTHQAVCYQVWDLGYQKTMFNNKARAKRMIRIGWELQELVKEGKFAGKRLTITQRYTASLHEKSNLTHHLVAWRGRELTKDERNNFDLEELVGRNCFISIVHAEGSNGKEYANIAAIIQLPDNIPVMLPENGRITPEWIGKEIAQALTQTEADDLNESSEQGLPD